MKSLLIQDTTKEERERIVYQALWGSCGIDCEFCSGCDNLRIEGMMCEHCEATVKKALEKVEGVISATASYREGTAVVQTDGSASSDALRQAVEAADYKVLE